MVALVSACATPMAPIVPMPSHEPDLTDRISFRLMTPAASDANRNAVTSGAANILMGSSIVIDVPADIRKRDLADDESADYTTRNYFNLAEQAIEKQLLLNGFVVKDRSKFEAILRDLRDQDCSGPAWYSCYDVDPAIEPILKELEDKRVTGQISDVDYA